MSTKDSLKAAEEFIDFVNESPSPYHAVKNVKNILRNSGFKELKERETWSSKELHPGSKFYVTRNGSSLIGVSIGGKYSPGEGISIVGAHTDSPCLRIKPISKRNKDGFLQVGVETYGGLIAHTWFDRDLSIAGRVYVETDKGTIEPRLIKVDKPLLRIPTLAIHFNRKESNSFEFNKETKMVPIAGQTAWDAYESKSADESVSCCNEDAKFTPEEFLSVKSVIERHGQSLVDLIAKECNSEPSKIEDFELILFDHQKSTIGGLNDEFIFSPRLDNLVSCFCAAKGLCESGSTLSEDSGIRLISLFDHEEIGSQSAQGAFSTFLPDIILRITAVTGTSPDHFQQTISKSFLLSSDMAHGVHPNYLDWYESSNKPQVNGGPVIKINANQRYSTNSPGMVIIKKCAEIAKVPLQLFVVRNDLPCGSTIGPILASKLGIRTLDLGNPQLSMHSIRETGGSYDIEKLCNLFKAYFSHYQTLECKVLCD